MHQEHGPLVACQVAFQTCDSVDAYPRQIRQHPHGDLAMDSSGESKHELRSCGMGTWTVCSKNIRWRVPAASVAETEPCGNRAVCLATFVGMR